MKTHPSLYLTVQSTGNGLVLHRLALDPAHFYNASDVTDMLWCGSSAKIAISNLKTAKIVVFQIEARDEHGGVGELCVIQENVLLGFERVFWSLDGCFLFVLLRHQVALRVWSPFCQQPVATLPAPKNSTSFDFDRGRERGRWLVILTRRQCADHIMVFDCHANFQMTRRLCTPEQACLEGVLFAAMHENSSRAAHTSPPVYAWEGAAHSGRVFFFTADGTSCRVITSLSADGDPVQGSGYERMTAWTDGGLIAALIHDAHSMTLWNGLLLKMGPRVHLSAGLLTAETIVYKERLLNGSQARYDSHAGLAAAASLQASTGHGSRRLAIEFSAAGSGSLAAVHSSEYANLLWIFKTEQLMSTARPVPMVVLHQHGAVQHFAWHNSGCILTLVTADASAAAASQLYVWQTDGCLCIPVPFIQGLRNVQWAGDCDTLLVSAPDVFCLAVPDWATV